MKAKNLYLVFLFLTFSCTHPKFDNTDLIFWGNPIEDYIESATPIFADFKIRNSIGNSDPTFTAASP